MNFQIDYYIVKVILKYRICVENIVWQYIFFEQMWVLKLLKNAIWFETKMIQFLDDLKFNRLIKFRNACIGVSWWINQFINESSEQIFIKQKFK